MVTATRMRSVDRRQPLLADSASASRPSATASHASRLVFTLGHGLNGASAGQTSPVELHSSPKRRVD
ncbi:hypothetical protein Y032_0007g3275 [Ancylostoma ceylanicum]|nr:hypothetical protein Y032_0007g3275 [Ancylostoma ceylanicum]